MEYFLRERIGDPELFVGRKRELAFYLKWISDIKKQLSKSSAILARRKMGKSALMERLYNITFYKNDGVIPFYYEVREGKTWVVDFCKDFFLTFIYQYMAFKTRKKEYLEQMVSSDFENVIAVAKKEGLDYLTEIIEKVAYEASHEYVDTLWLLVRDTPRKLAARRDEFIVQMIDEFQFLNSTIYWDKKKENLADDMAAGYLGTAESKIAPLLVSGSWVGWLMNLLYMMLPARFVMDPLPNMPQDEAIEMVFKYSRVLDVPVSEEVAFLIAQLSEGSPFYTSAIIRSRFRDKNLLSIEGLSKTLEFEILQGEIKSTWMEYVLTAFSRINDKHAKNIVLYLCKNRDREVTRKELLEKLHLPMSDGDLEKKLKAMVMADIIEQGSSNFRYRGVRDNIFDKVFRGVYQEEIDGFDVAEVRKEHEEAFEKMSKKYRQLQGKYNYQKGYFAEYLILDQLRYHAREKKVQLKSITCNLPGDFEFCDYSHVWNYRWSPEYAEGFSVDIFARSRSAGDYSIIGEVKNRDTKKFSRDEVLAFEKKLEEIKKIENLSQVLGFIFSRPGFTGEAENLCREKGIAYSSDEQWLDV